LGLQGQRQLFLDRKESKGQLVLQGLLQLFLDQLGQGVTLDL
jgi:hypothetical protein